MTHNFELTGEKGDKDTMTPAAKPVRFFADSPLFFLRTKTMAAPRLVKTAAFGRLLLILAVHGLPAKCL